MKHVLLTFILLGHHALGGVIFQKVGTDHLALAAASRDSVSKAEGNPRTTAAYKVMFAVPGWAAACGFNADYFARLFKTHTGTSPKAWLTESRLQRATRLHASSGATVEELADHCGFNCPFHFSRTFKLRFGIPPASYRHVRQAKAFDETRSARKSRKSSSNPAG